MRSDSLYGDLHEVVTRLHRLLRGQNAALTPAQLSLVLRLVADGPSTVGALAKAQQVSEPTVSRMIDGLELKNLVRRARDKRDRRVVYAVATREGAAVSRKPAADSGLSRHLSGLAAGERQALAGALATLNKLLKF